jgi:hypothetical protein
VCGAVLGDFVQPASLTPKKEERMDPKEFEQRLEEITVPITRSDLPEEGKDLLIAPWKPGIGFVDAIHGDGGAECEEYRPTRYELEQLARFWAKEILDIQVFWFYYAQSGSTEIRLEPYARTRLHRIRQTLGKDTVKAIVDAVRDQERQRMGEEDWRIFSEGTEEEVKAFQDKIQRQLDENEKDRGLKPGTEEE